MRIQSYDLYFFIYNFTYLVCVSFYLAFTSARASDGNLIQRQGMLNGLNKGVEAFTMIKRSVGEGAKFWGDLKRSLERSCAATNDFKMVRVSFRYFHYI